MNPIALRLFAIPCLLVAAATLPVTTNAAGEPDLSGEWVIDFDASDEPHEVLDTAIRGRSGLGRFGRVGVGVSVLGIPVEDVADIARDGDTPNQREEDPREDVHGHVSDAIDALSIEQSSDMMRIDYDGTGISLYRNGTQMANGDATVKAGWRQQAYVVERESPARAKVTEEFRLDRRNPNRLTWVVTTKLESGKNVKIQRVYDRADES
jgi:hypothetical protein